MLLPVWGPIDADFTRRLGSIRMRNHGRHTCEVAHDEGHQICRHGRGSRKVGGCQATWQLFRGDNRHVGQSSQPCCGGQADVKGSLQTTE